MLKILDLIFPPRCPFCFDILTSSVPVCEKCAKKLPYVKDPVCRKCGRPIGEFSYDLCRVCRINKVKFERACAPLLYKGSVRKSILRFKFYHHPSYAKGFAFLMVQRLLNMPDILKDVSFITYVPQNRNAHLLKGYNQAKLLADEISKLTGLEVKSTLLRKNGVRQATLKKQQRFENVKKAYFKKDLSLSGNALLIDDVLTTGATTGYCAFLLKRMGCDKVYVCTIATVGDDTYEKTHN